MKKITLLALLASASAFAQQSYTDLDGTVPQGTQVETTITTVDNRQPIIGTYSDQGSFDTALNDNCSDTTLTSEDFVGGPGAITTCGPMISSGDGGACFGAGDLEVGFDVQASNASDVVFIPAGGIGNTNELVGANTFAEYTIINFDPGVYAVSMDLWNNSDPSTEIRVFGAGGLIDMVTVTVTVAQQEFFGVIADEEILSIEIQGANDSGELFGVFAYGADCMILGVNDNLLSQIALFPNPATDKVNISLPAGVEVEAVVLYDVLGKGTAVNMVDNQINVAQLAQGMYLVNIETTQGTVVKQIVKR